MNMQNKVYTIQFSHHPMRNSQSVREQQLWNPELADVANFTKLLKKTKLPEKFELPNKRGFKLMEERSREPQDNPHS